MAPALLPRRVFTSTDHPGKYPVPVASVVIAESEGQARALLSEALAARGLPGPFTLVEIDTNRQAAHVLSDGDY